MTEIEKRDRLAEPEQPERTYGECFIAIHMKDGTVHTMSGIVELVEEKPDTEDYIRWHDGRVFFDVHGWDVTLHFLGNIVEEVRPMDGKEGSQ